MAEEALSLALRALSQKERSVAELGRWLRRRGVSADQTDEVIDHLASIGTLDDARFAARFSEDKRELSGWGSDRIRAALIERGIGRDEIEAALGDDGGELARAQALLEERGVDLEDDHGRQRALSLLARRGYPSELAYEAIERVERNR